MCGGGDSQRDRTPMTLTIDIHDENGMVIFEVETDDAEVSLPLDPDVAESIAVRLMVAAEKVRGGPSSGAS